MFCSNLPFSGWHKMYYNRFSLLLNPVRKHTREKGTKQTAANLEKGKWIWEIFPRQNCIASVGKRWREAEDGYFEIFTWEPGDVIVINRLWSKWEGSVSSSLLRVQPVLGPLNNTLLLVVYNHCKYRNASSSCCAFFLCYLKGLAGDFVYFIEVRAPCIWPLVYNLITDKKGNQTSFHGFSGNSDWVVMVQFMICSRVLPEADVKLSSSY